MPMDRSKYPPDWEAIAAAAKERANWRCEGCGQSCRRPGEIPVDFCARLRRDAYEEDEEGLIGHLIGEVIEQVIEHPQRYVLTVHHPDRNPGDPGARLQCLCAPCHLRAEGPLRRSRMRECLEKGQLAGQEVAL